MLNPEGNYVFLQALSETQATRTSPTPSGDQATMRTQSQVPVSLAGQSKDMKAHYGDKSPGTIKAKSQTGQEDYGSPLTFKTNFSPLQKVSAGYDCQTPGSPVLASLELLMHANMPGSFNRFLSFQLFCLFSRQVHIYPGLKLTT